NWSRPGASPLGSPANGNAPPALSNSSSPRTSRRRKSRSAELSSCCRELSETQQFDHRAAVRQLFEPQRGLDQCILLSLGHGRAGELTKLIDDLCFAGEVLLAAARCVASFALD